MADVLYRERDGEWIEFEGDFDQFQKRMGFSMTADEFIEPVRKASAAEVTGIKPIHIENASEQWLRYYLGRRVFRGQKAMEKSQFVLEFYIRESRH